jgi:hypothetical protein
MAYEAEDPVAGVVAVGVLYMVVWFLLHTHYS